MKKLIYLVAALCMAACGGAEPAADLHVMTFNMRYDNPEDGEHNWRFRKERAAEAIVSRGIDLLGTQEVLANQFADLRELLPGYEAVGVGREDGTAQGEFNAVFWRADRFTLLDSGTFWLSETPETPGSKGWDGACERIATWAVLRERGGAELLFVNTHLDHVGKAARREGVALLAERIEALRGGRPVILTGDFNSEQGSPVIAHVQHTGLLCDAKRMAAETAGPDWSFSDFGEIPVEYRPLLDYIFVSAGIEVRRYAVLDETATGGFVSDHAPVEAEISIVR